MGIPPSYETHKGPASNTKFSQNHLRTEILEQTILAYQQASSTSPTKSCVFLVAPNFSTSKRVAMKTHQRTTYAAEKRKPRIEPGALIPVCCDKTEFVVTNPKYENITKQQRKRDTRFTWFPPKHEALEVRPRAKSERGFTMNGEKYTEPAIPVTLS
jgi:hypothetical protein